MQQHLSGYGKRNGISGSHRGRKSRERREMEREKVIKEEGRRVGYKTAELYLTHGPSGWAASVNCNIMPPYEAVSTAIKYFELTEKIYR